MPKDRARPDPKNITPVFQICVAYESGIGHGLKASACSNPYAVGTDEREAWQHGYDLGLERGEATP